VEDGGSGTRDSGADGAPVSVPSETPKYWKLGIGVPSAEIPWISASRWQLLARFFSQPPVESGNEQLRFLSILLFFALNILNE
jgi:hypothetical protein